MWPFFESLPRISGSLVKWGPDVPPEQLWSHVMDEICEKHQKGLKYYWGNPRLKEMFVVQNIEAIIIRVISF